jgi:hypothetical protein
MHLTLNSVSARAQAVVCALAVTIGLTVAPALISTAGAAPVAPAAPAAPVASATTSPACASARSALAKAKKQQAAAKKAVAKAKKALAVAKKAKVHHAAKVKKAKKVLAKAKKHYAATNKAVTYRQGKVRSACAAPAGKPGTNPGTNTGKKMTALLEQFLPGVSQFLSPNQLSALLAGFNAGKSLDPTAAASLLTGILDPSSITALLGGASSPQALTALITDITSQLSTMGGGLPIPSTFDPTSLFNTFAGIFGTLDPSQLGSLLSLLTGAVGSSGSTFSPTQLTSLLNSLVPGLAGQFSPTQLTSMLSALNGQGLSAGMLANLLGGQFSVNQLQSVLGGTAGQALIGSVINQVVAELGTAGGGNLQLPGSLNAGQVANLISTLTSVVSGVLGNIPVLPVVCGLIPIPGLCS